MLDKRTEMMLSVANLLTAEDLDRIRATAPVSELHTDPAEPIREVTSEVEEASDQGTVVMPAVPTSSGITQGERERMRTRESKISTACAGRRRQKHDWWPVNTELVGQIGSETFTAIVIVNSQVKSGRSIRITSGAVAGEVCRTPTRAALEATEAYRQANNLGRGGGVTNGWEFWQLRT